MRHSRLDVENLPTRREIVSDREKRAELKGKIVAIAANIRDSDSFWPKMGQSLLGFPRYKESPPERQNKISQKFMFFQTRAFPYNHHPRVFH